MTQNAPMTIYEAIGGQPAILAAVDLFYHRLLADAHLAPYFANVPIARLKGHQAMFLAYALHGPARYRGRSMREAHAGLNITDADFDRVAEHLAQTLSSLGVTVEQVEAVLATIGPLRAEIVAGT
jgi:hemoglobin